MPKERTHFLAVSQVIDRLQGTPLSSILKNHEHIAYLGSITHDTLYYHPTPGAGSPTLASVPDRLHGTQGEDTFIPLSFMLEQAPTGTIGEKYLALFVGLLSHVFLDAEFHPFVYFTTGSIYDTNSVARTEAIRRHRRLEVMLDLVLCGEPNGRFSFDIASAVSHEFPFLRAAYRDLLDPHSNDSGTEIACAATIAVKRQARMHRLFSNRFLCFLSGGLFKIGPPPAREILALFYSNGLKQKLRQFDGLQTYQNPATGEEHVRSLAEMVENAVHKTVDHCIRMLSHQSRHLRFDPSSPGPSLELGEPGLSVDKMRFFSTDCPKGT